MRKLFIGIILAAFGLVLLPKTANASSVINSRIDLNTGEIALGVVDDVIQDEWRVSVSTGVGGGQYSLGNAGSASIQDILNQICYHDGTPTGKCTRTLNDRDYVFSFDAYKNGQQIDGATVVYRIDLSGMPDNPVYKQWFQSTTDPNGGSLGAWTGKYSHNSGDVLDIRRFYERIISNSLRAPDDSEFDHLEIDGETYDLDDSYPITHDFTIKIFWRASGSQPSDDDEEEETDPVIPSEDDTEEAEDEEIENPDTAIGEVVELDDETKTNTSLLVFILGASAVVLAAIKCVAKKRR